MNGDTGSEQRQPYQRPQLRRWGSATAPQSQHEGVLAEMQDTAERLAAMPAHDEAVTERPDAG